MLLKTASIRLGKSQLVGTSLEIPSGRIVHGDELHEDFDGQRVWRFAVSGLPGVLSIPMDDAEDVRLPGVGTGRRG